MAPGWSVAYPTIQPGIEVANQSNPAHMSARGAVACPSMHCPSLQQNAVQGRSVWSELVAVVVMKRLPCMQGLKFTYDKAARVLKVAGSYSM